MGARLAVRTLIVIDLALLAGLARGARAQNPPAPAAPPPPATVSGAIVDSAGVPIPHAVLSVVGESLRVVTDSQGRFHLAVPPGPRLLAARALGYRPLMWSVTLVSGQEATGHIRMERLSVVLREINVVAQPYLPSRLAGFYRRQRTGMGTFLDSGTIARRFTNSTADLLQMVPGLHVRPRPNDPFRAYISFPRCTRITANLRSSTPSCLGVPGCATNDHPAEMDQPTSVGVYVDGWRVPGGPEEALAMINGADVAAIEVYRGPSELPFEFMSEDCAAIVIWTRY
jgi:hypothetical protein